MKHARKMDQTGDQVWQVQAEELARQSAVRSSDGSARGSRAPLNGEPGGPAQGLTRKLSNAAQPMCDLSVHREHVVHPGGHAQQHLAQDTHVVEVLGVNGGLTESARRQVVLLVRRVRDP